MALSVARRYGYRSLQAPRTQEAWIVFWLAVILFNPYFLADLARVTDSAVNILFIAVLMACALGARHATAGSWIVAGVTLAIFTMVRPNAITLILALFAVAWLVRAPTMVPILGPVVLTVSTAVAFVAFCLLVAGKPFLWPTNGGYNLFAGNNPFALAQLVIDYNGEYSLPDALVWCGSSDGKLHELDYTRCTIRFVSENPGEFLRLLAYKAFNLFFRPNLRLADTPLKVAAQYAIMAPAVAWWAAFVVSRSFRLSLPGRVGVLFLLLYGAPFVLTNVDQRFRIPFDVIYAMSALAFACGDRASTLFRPLLKAPRRPALTSL